MVGFEGNTFSRTKENKKIEFEYSFCSPTFCNDFGSALEEPIPNLLVIEDKNKNEIALDSKKEFCLNSDTIGYFYFNEAENATGKYYLKRDSVFLEGLSIYFDNTEIQEVESIIKTIVEK